MRRRKASKYRVKKSASKSFTRVYDDAIPSVQRQIVERALIPFLDNIRTKDAKYVISIARRIAKKAEKIPQVDMAAKKTEINGLLDELAKDAKLPARSGTSKYGTLLLEVMESVADWLNDLWSLTYEFGLDFPRAHSCLLFSMGVLDHVQSMKSGWCHCMLETISVPVTIRDRSGAVVKEFAELGLWNVERAILWVWREVFLSMLASNIRSHVKLMPELLAEIDDLIGWTGLERLVLGGVTYEVYEEEREKRKEEEEEEEEEEGTFKLACRVASPEVWNLDADSNDVDDMFYEEHWNDKIVHEVPRFRRFVYERMLDIFRATPQVLLYNSLKHLTEQVDGWVMNDLQGILAYLAPTSSMSISAALEIYAMECRPDLIAPLVQNYAFLLRPRDSGAFQEAIRTLAKSADPSYLSLALRIAKREFIAAVYFIKHALRGPFSRVDTPPQRAELKEILSLPRASAERRERVHSWVEAAQTPWSDTGNPMAFAAMVMGMDVPIAIPVPLPNPNALGPGGPGDAGGGGGIAAAAAAAVNAALDAQDAGHWGLMDIDPHDPDFADLREEHKPDLKGRFEGWLDVLKAVGFFGVAAVAAYDKREREREGRRERTETRDERENEDGGGPKENGFGESTERIKKTLEELYGQTWRIMPWLLGSDIIEEMIIRIADKPSKRHICHALDTLMVFMKEQRKRAKQKKNIKASALLTAACKSNGTSLLSLATGTNVRGMDGDRGMSTQKGGENVEGSGETNQEATLPLFLPDSEPLPSSGRIAGPSGILHDHEYHDIIGANGLEEDIEVEVGGAEYEHDFDVDHSDEEDEDEEDEEDEVEGEDELPPLEPVSEEHQDHDVHVHEHEAEGEGDGVGPVPYFNFVPGGIEDLD